MRRSASLSLGFTTSLAWPLAHLPAWAGGHAGLVAGIFYAGVRFGFSCSANFGWGQNSPNTLRPQPRKNSLNNSFYFISAAAACPPSAEKIYKRCFCFSLRVGESKRTKSAVEIRRIEAARL